MKTILTALAFYVVFCTRLFAAVPCTPLPFNFMNGQVADATQVMANYNFIISCLQNAAAAGTNTDIVALGGLTTPISPSQGGTSAFLGQSPSTGSANNQVVSTVLPSYAQTTLSTVVFIAGFTNTGPMTTPGGGLQFGTAPLTSIYRRTTDGLVPLAGGEIIAGSVTAAVFDGVRYELITNVSPFPIGTIIETAAANADAGFLLLNGQCISTTTYTTLVSKLSLTAGSCGGGLAQLPDSRGRVAAMPDSGGSANLTLICAAQTVGVSSCGGQNYAIRQTDLPNVTPGLTTTVTMSPHAHTYTQPNAPATLNYLAGSTTTPLPSATVNGTTAAVATSTVTDTPASATTGWVNSLNGGVTQTLIPTVQPTLFLNKQIKY